MRFDGMELRRQRKEAGYRRVAVAAAIDKSVESLDAYENGKVDPPASVVARLCDAIGIDAGVLFTDDDTGDQAVALRAVSGS